MSPIDRNPAPPAILIVDDEPAALKSFSRTLWSSGHETVLTCSDARDVHDLLDEHEVELLLLDLFMPHVGGEQLLEEIVQRHPDLPVVIVTADHDVKTVVRCMKLGAIDYLLKPIDAATLTATVDKALEQSALRYESARLREQFFNDKLSEPEAFEEIVTADPAMLRLFAYLEAISRGTQPVLITGETGTGKELVARALHRVSHRSGPFVAVNVAGLDDTMFADTLFGHAVGAYTGADRARRGMVEKAADGTLFLDEIGDLSEASQVKLLRLIQEREYFRLGSDTPLQLRARVVTATHKDPSELRKDLYYRLRAYHVEVPPLRDRLGDLPLLVADALSRAAADLGRPRPTVPAELFLHLANYTFPGNVRELHAMVFDSVARHEHGVMSLEGFLRHVQDPGEAPRPVRRRRIAFPYPMPTLREGEEAMVEEALRRVQDNQSAAARMLGVSRQTISRFLRRKRRANDVLSAP